MTTSCNRIRVCTSSKWYRHYQQRINASNRFANVRRQTRSVNNSFSSHSMDGRRRTVSLWKFVHTILFILSWQLMRGSRIVIPHSLRQDILKRIHTGHQGITKCRDKAKQSVWWPGLATELETLVKNCDTCCKHQQPVIQPLIPSSLPEFPWQKVGTDLFDYLT